MSLWMQILAGLGSGILTGVFLGEMAAPLRYAADGFVKLLQMTVLPYVVISILTSLGSLSYAEAKRLGTRAGAVLAGLWLTGLGLALLVPLAFPQIPNATFFSASALEQQPHFDFLNLYIPSNPFHSLANNIVPAVVLFSVILGVALIGVERKEPLLDALGVAGAALARATRFVVKLTPFGIFAVAAYAAGTLSIEQIARIELYLVTYVLVSTLAVVWIIPGLISAFTPIRFGEVFGATRDALVTAFMVGDLFVVLPSLTEECKGLLRKHRITDEHTATLPDVIVPASFNFPHAGKLLSLSFVLFAGWFSDAPIDVERYPELALTGLLTFFGSLNAAVPFLLDMFRIPADTFQLFVATSVINARFGTLLAAVHTVAIAVLGSAAVVGAIRFSAWRLLRYLVVTAVLLGAVLGGVRMFFARSLANAYQGAELVYGMSPRYQSGEARMVKLEEVKAVPRAAGGVLKAIQERGAVRVCVMDNRLPFAFLDRQKRLIGFDVEMAQRLAKDLQVRAEFVAAELQKLPGALDEGKCDIAMSGIPVTPLRMMLNPFSEPYLDETLAFIVRDHLRSKFTTWEGIRAMGAVEVHVPNLPYFVAAIRERAPQAKLELFDPSGNVAEMMGKWEVIVAPAERGSVMTLLNPRFSVVIPEPGLIKVPLGYPVARQDAEWLHFVDTWIELKRKDNTIAELYDHWILGKTQGKRQPRWSIARNVLGWVK